MFLGLHHASKELYAIKRISRNNLSVSDTVAIKNEALIQASLDHPTIVRLYDFIETNDCFYLIMELMKGGDLFDRIGCKKNYSEMDARDVCRNMLLAVQYCHEQNVAHCDLKPKNMMVVVSYFTCDDSCLF